MKPSDSTRKIRIMIVEDHVLVRMGLVSAANAEPDMEVVAELEDGRQVIETFRQKPVDVVVLDLRLPKIDGVEIIKGLRREFASARILVLSSYGGGDDITRAVQEGASGYILKGMELERLLEGIRVIHGGGEYFPREVVSRMTERVGSDLSSRELDVLRLLTQGKNNKEMASHLGIAEATIKTHLTNIFAKLGALDRTQAMAIAIKRQILQLE